MKVFLALVATVVSFSLMLWRQALDIYSSNPAIEGSYWAAFSKIVSGGFSTPAMQLLLVFLLAAPTWVAWISGKLRYLRWLVYAIIFAWLVMNVLFAMNYASYANMIGWFMYSSSMLLLGLLLMLYRIFNKNEDYELRVVTTENNDEPSYQKNKTWY